MMWQMILRPLATVNTDTMQSQHFGTFCYVYQSFLCWTLEEDSVVFLHSNRF